MNGPLPSALSPPAPAAAALPERVSPRPAAGVSCDNCGATVSGKYCGTCGQRLEPPVHSLGHFATLAAEDLTHADSRLWRTLLLLLFYPGQLTREFLHGRRARYLPPLRLYLVLSVVFFLSAGLLQPQLQIVKLGDEPASTGQPAKTTISSSKIYDVTAPDRPGETHQQRIERECSGWKYNGPWAARLGPALPQACRKMLADNGQSLREAFLHNVPRAMFLFLPLLAGSMMLLYWRPRHYYVEHLLLFLHNHAVVFLVGTVALLLGSIWHIPNLRTGVWLYFAWYMYRSMRVVYRQGRLLTLSKLALLSFFYLIFAALMLGITTAYSALTL